MAIGLFTAFPIILAFMFSVRDVSEVTSHGWPAVELLYQVTGNKAATVALTVLLTLIYVCTSTD